MFNSQHSDFYSTPGGNNGRSLQQREFTLPGQEVIMTAIRVNSFTCNVPALVSWSVD